MKFVIAALVATVVANKSDFPTDYSVHTRCHANSVVSATCSETYSKFLNSVNNTTNPPGGRYLLVEARSGDYIWATRHGFPG